MILKILLVAGVIAFVYFMFIKKKPPIAKSEGESKKEQKESSEMVECSTCDIYCSLDDAILSNGKYYCSQECVEKAS
jgi:uncharacterized protein